MPKRCSQCQGYFDDSDKKCPFCASVAFDINTDADVEESLDEIANPAVTSNSKKARPVRGFDLKSEAISNGPRAASRVYKYGSLFESVGSVLHILNLIALVIIWISYILLVDNEMWIDALAFLAISFLAFLAYLQTSFIRGIASYFQMKASQYFENEAEKE